MKETYQQFCNRLQTEPSADSAKAFVDHVLAGEEIKRHYDEIFLASLHPDGGNAAGFHGVGEDEQ